MHTAYHVQHTAQKNVIRNTTYDIRHTNKRWNTRQAKWEEYFC